MILTVNMMSHEIKKQDMAQLYVGVFGYTICIQKILKMNTEKIEFKDVRSEYPKACNVYEKILFIVAMIYGAMMYFARTMA